MKIFIKYICIALIWTVIILLQITSCNHQDQSAQKIRLFEAYFSAVNSEEANKWQFTTDTVKLWFDDRENDPVVQVKGQPSRGPWKEWDEEMNSASYYDSLWFDMEENAVKGYFYERNDFYELVGKPPTKTLRTYWFDENDKITEMLIYWIPEENRLTSEYLEPVKAWALEWDSALIMDLYPDDRIIPSRENAIRWKALLREYREEN